MAMIECPKCEKHFYNYQEKVSEPIKCPHCGFEINKDTPNVKKVDAQSSQDTANKLNTESSYTSVKETVSMPINNNSNNTMAESKIGDTLKTLSLVCLVLSAIGSLVMCFQVSSTFGISALIVSLVLWLLVYAAGEVCCLLTQINAKLGNMQK